MCSTVKVTLYGKSKTYYLKKIAEQGYTNFPKILEPPQKYRRQKSNMGKFHTDGPKTLGATVQNLIATATWRLGFVNPRYKVHETSARTSLRRNMMWRSYELQKAH
jgi:hypothetical protein